MNVPEVNSNKIHADSKEDFCLKINPYIKNPPKEFPSVSFQSLVAKIPDNLSDNYSYNPTLQNDRYIIKFNCDNNKGYNLTIEKTEPLALERLRINNDTVQQSPIVVSKQDKPTIVFSGPVTNQAVSHFPQDLQPQAQRFADSHFPYTATINDKGAVTVGGTKEHHGIVLNLSDLLAQVEEGKK